jgi:hypothetical protein
VILQKNHIAFGGMTVGKAQKLAETLNEQV